MKAIIAKIRCTDNGAIQVLAKSYIDPGHQDPITIQFKNLHTIFSSSTAHYTTQKISPTIPNQPPYRPNITNPEYHPESTI